MVRAALLRGASVNKIRCAIYTRKSTEDGLDQAFNSLDAQREACEAYIASQKHEGWKLLTTHYDDGGKSGGNLERPALKQLLSEIEAGRVDMVVVYKIDRLTRSLTDFAKLVERFDQVGASFVSVTQQFNTSTSMGRLTLNVLLSFAQFEKEVTAERIRDKIAASKKKGMWMGGFPPYGYDKTDAGLKVNQIESEVIRDLFEAYVRLGCVRKLLTYAEGQNYRTRVLVFKSGNTRGGGRFNRGGMYHLLSNPLYIGKIKHHDQVFDGLHEPIIDEELWELVQATLSNNRIKRKRRSNAASRSPLAGKLYNKNGRRLTPSHACKGSTRYRYYLSKDPIDNDRFPAAELEGVIESAIRNDPDYRTAKAQSKIGSGAVLDLVQSAAIHNSQIDILFRLSSDQTKAIRVPFTARRRGVETKLVIPNEQTRVPDQVMLRRVLRALNWTDRIKAGESVKAIAESENVSSDFITHNIDLAFLSPEILRAILEGKQRPDLSTAQLSRRRWSANWAEQRPDFIF